MSLNVTSTGGDQGDTFNLNLAGCSASTIGQAVELSSILDNPNLELMPTEASIILESCTNVVQTARGSKVNARNVFWAVLRDTLEHCSIPEGDLMLGHYHHPMFHGPSAQEHPDLRPPWVRFMEENANSLLTQNPQVLSYMGQMVAWSASYMSMALEDENQRVPVQEMLQQIMQQNPFSDL